MKPEAQQIAIAEACGEDNDSIVRGLTPDYLHDLNAMHEAEKMLDYEPDYIFWLREILGVTDARGDWDDGLWAQVVMATAAQRAEAFLRTINKWEESS